jgi:hypothetical protein
MVWGRGSILYAASVGLVLLAAGCGSSSSTSSTTGSTTTAAGNNTAHAVHAGLGATLTDWEAAHPRGTEGCSAGECFGSRVQVSPNESQYEFVDVETTPEGRVDGYTQALGGDAVIPAVAKHIVLALLPRDTRVLETFVGHEGGSCEIINVRSKTLGHWFANPKVGDGSGVVSIDIHGDSENGESTYPGNLSLAGVSLGPTHHGTAC